MDAACLRLVDYAPMFEAFVESTNAESLRRAACSRFKRKAVAAAERPEGNSTSLLRRAPGDARVAAVAKMLDSFPGYARSESQKRFHRAFIGACLPHIYGSEDFERVRARVLEEHGLDKVQYEVNSFFNTQIVFYDDSL